MPLYDIGYHSHEDSEYWQYEHPLVYDDAALMRIVEDCLYDALRRVGASDAEMSVASERTWLRQFSEVMGMKEFHHALMKRGFKKLHYAARVSLWGWAECVSTSGWNTCRTDEEREMSARLRKRLGLPEVEQ